MAYMLRPVSSVPLTERFTYPWVYRSGTFNIEGLAIAGGLSADADHFHVWKLPPALPSGTPQLEFNILRVPQSSGAFQIRLYWANRMAEASFAAGLPQEGGGTTSVTFSLASVATMSRVTFPMTIDTPMPNGYILLRLAFLSSSWTYDQPSIWIPTIIWE